MDIHKFLSSMVDSLDNLDSGGLDSDPLATLKCIVDAKIYKRASDLNSKDKLKLLQNYPLNEQEKSLIRDGRLQIAIGEYYSRVVDVTLKLANDICVDYHDFLVTKNWG